MKFLKWLALGLIGLLIIYFLGPQYTPLELKPGIKPIDKELNQLDSLIQIRESKVQNLKPDNQSRIIWADSLKKSQTEYSVVYLHGFSASPKEGDPVHKEFARKFGCNLYIPRLYKHGLKEEEPLVDFREDSLLNSAKEAVEIGQKLGKKVILMSTSTGGTLSLILASANRDIHAQILYSPNIDIHDQRTFILLQPWGLPLARQINGDKYYEFDGPEGIEKYWTTKYRMEALVSLKSLLNQTMKAELFEKIQQPVFVAYYPKDDVVSVPAILQMYEELGSPDSLKRLLPYPESENHAMASGIWSKNTDKLLDETSNFANEVLGMRAKE